MNNSRRRLKKIQQAIGVKDFKVLAVEFVDGKYRTFSTGEEVAAEEIEKLEADDQAMVLLVKWVGPNEDID